MSDRSRIQTIRKLAIVCVLCLTLITGIVFIVQFLT